MTSTPPSATLHLERNRATCFLPRTARDGLDVLPVSATRAYQIAMSVHRARQHAAGSGFRLYWMAGEVFGAQSVPTEPSSYLVVGRHTQCDVSLLGDPTVALRHLLVRTVVLDDGCPCLAVLDLRTAEGFELADGSTQRAVLARGPLFLRVGMHALVALPIGEVLPAEMPGLQPVPAGGHPYRDAAAVIASSPLARPNYRTHVTLLPAPAELHESGCFEVASPSSDPHVYEVVLEAVDDRSRVGARRARVCLSREDLERGVLVGRSDRCLDDGLRAVMSEVISRVHLLLLRGTRGSVAYDVASSQGTTSRGRPIRCIALSDFGTELVLAREYGVRLTWRALA